MPKTEIGGLAERMKLAAEARTRRLDLFRPKAAAPDPLFSERQAMRSAELEQVRAARADARLAKRERLEQAQAAIAQAISDTAAATSEARKAQRKERKALTVVEAKAKRDARYAARKARK